MELAQVSYEIYISSSVLFNINLIYKLWSEALNRLAVPEIII